MRTIMLVVAALSSMAWASDSPRMLTAGAADAAWVVTQSASGDITLRVIGRDGDGFVQHTTSLTRFPEFLVSDGESLAAVFEPGAVRPVRRYTLRPAPASVAGIAFHSSVLDALPSGELLAFERTTGGLVARYADRTLVLGARGWGEAAEDPLAPSRDRVFEAVRDSDALRVRLVRPGGALEVTTAEVREFTRFVRWGEGFAILEWTPSDGPLGSLRVDLYNASGRELASGTAQVPPPIEAPQVASLMLVVGSIVLSVVVYVASGLPGTKRGAFAFPADAVLASPGRRIAGFLIDVSPGAVLSSVVWSVPFYAAIDLSQSARPEIGPLPMVTMLAVTALHVSLAEGLGGRSLGKVLLGMRVVARDGGSPTLVQAVARTFVKLTCPPLAMLMVLSRDEPAPGSMGTLVVRRRQAPSDPPA
ncbi:MAG: RDD family protein [Planctomycetota bacterium]